MVSAILRVYSYIFQLLLSLALLAVGVVAAMSDSVTFETEFLPWSGAELRNWLIAAGVFGILSVILAFRGKLRILFLLFTIFVTVFITRGIFLSGYRFDGPAEFRWSLILWAGAILTIFGALSRVRQPIGRVRGRY